MNLLVTNTRNAQAYGIIRSLRPYARKIVATMYGRNRFVARLSHAANSRYVDGRYLVPSPIEDWRKGNIQKQNTEREEQYIQAILKICEQEAIDVIFPSWEPKVYIFSKNKHRFKEKNIMLPIPDYDVLISAMDKYRLITAAREVGLPCPKTFIIKDEDELRSVESLLEYPLVLKPRMSSGSRGFYLVKNRAELLDRIFSTGRPLDWTLIQEYIPGSAARRFASVWVVLDKNYNLLGSSVHVKLRTIFRDESSQASAWESVRDDDLVSTATQLCRKLKLIGTVNIQSKLDPRDNVHKLLEINPRVGYNFWIPQNLGLDIPSLALQIAYGNKIEAIPRQDDQIIFLAPIQDVAAFAISLTDLATAKLLGARPNDPENAPLPVLEILRSYRDAYCNPKKVFDPFFSGFFDDPLVSLTWWAAFGVFNLRAKFQTRSWPSGQVKPVTVRTRHKRPSSRPV